MENPKPLNSLIFYFISPEGYHYFNAVVGAFFILGLATISRKITGSALEGVAAGVIFGLASHVSSAVFFGIMSVYATLAVWAVSFYLKERYGLTALLLFFAGLSRPDAWLLSTVFIGAVYFTARPAWRPIFCLSLLSPLVWAFFDFKASGDFLRSAHLTHNFSRMIGFSSIGLIQQAPILGEMVKVHFGLPMTVLGVVAAAVLF